MDIGAERRAILRENILAMKQLTNVLTALEQMAPLVESMRAV